MKGLFCTVAAVATLAATTAEACGGRYYNKPFFAQGQVRAADGEWRDVFIEGSGAKVRVEAEDPRAPWGRLAITGDFNGEATVFSVATQGQVPMNARYGWKTSLSEALDMVGLGTPMLDGLNALWDTARMGRHVINGFECVYTDPDANLGPEPFRRTTCLATDGVPVAINDPNGEPIYRLTKVTRRPIPDARFGVPRGWTISDQTPDYVTQWGCGMGRLYPRKKS